MHQMDSIPLNAITLTSHRHLPYKILIPSTSSTTRNSSKTQYSSFISLAESLAQYAAQARMMDNQLLSSFSLLLAILLHCTTTLIHSQLLAPSLPPASPAVPLPPTPPLLPPLPPMPAVLPPTAPLLPPLPPSLPPLPPTPPSPPPTPPSLPPLAPTAPPSLAPLSPPPPSLSPLPLVPSSPTPVSLAPLSPVPSAPAINITAILERPGRFSSLIRLLKTTQVDDRISTLLSESKQGLTMFAPTDNAFATLKSGTLNSLSVQQQVQVVLYHMLTSYFPISQFQSASNPLRTLAGDTGGGDYPLNVTTSSNLVNITSGLVSTTVGKTLYADGQLAVYQVDKVLLPPRIFAASPPAPAPSKPTKQAADGPSADSNSGGTAADEFSGAVTLRHLAGLWLGGAALLAAFSFL